MRLQNYIKITIVLSGFIVNVQAAPLISKIVNHSDFGYVIVEHSDNSSCSLADKGIVIDAKSEFLHEFLLEPGKPSVRLRPVYYLDAKTSKKITFVDQNYEIVPELLDVAHELWKNGKGNKKFKKSEDWLNLLIGMDITVVPHEVEIFGYLLNLSRVIVKNNIHKPQIKWISFAKGIFSKLALELDITQHRRKGIRANMKVLHGEGGVCVETVVDGKVVGKVEKLSAAPSLHVDMHE